MQRPDALADFLDAAFAAFNRFARDTRSRHSIQAIDACLDTPGVIRETPGNRLAICDRYLDAALAAPTEDDVLRSLLAGFKALEPLLEWKPRPSHNDTASENFATGHANAMIVGPDGLEHRQDAWLGVSLMAPETRYPDHNHPPEETYLVLSGGQFMQEGRWFTPGIGGSFYNPPGIRHAMRSGETPLLALWALRPDRTAG
jgi:quercetin dioxygenase-like cupin family protein